MGFTTERMFLAGFHLSLSITFAISRRTRNYVLLWRVNPNPFVQNSAAVFVFNHACNPACVWVAEKLNRKRLRAHKRILPGSGYPVSGPACSGQRGPIGLCYLSHTYVPAMCNAFGILKGLYPLRSQGSRGGDLRPLVAQQSVAKRSALTHRLAGMVGSWVANSVGRSSAPHTPAAPAARRIESCPNIEASISVTMYPCFRGIAVPLFPGYQPKTRTPVSGVCS